MLSVPPTRLDVAFASLRERIPNDVYDAVDRAVADLRHTPKVIQITGAPGQCVTLTTGKTLLVQHLLKRHGISATFIDPVLLMTMNAAAAAQGGGGSGGMGGTRRNLLLDIAKDAPMDVLVIKHVHRLRHLSNIYLTLLKIIEEAAAGVILVSDRDPKIPLVDIHLTFVTVSFNANANVNVSDSVASFDAAASKDAGVLPPTWAKDASKRTTDALTRILAPAPAGAGAGVLLFGDTGCGKSLLARALASQWTVIRVEPSDMVASYVGDAERRIHALFARARAAAPSVVLIDDLDTLVHDDDDHGCSGGGSGGGYSGNIVATLKLELDECVAAAARVAVVVTARSPGGVPARLLRSGRIQTHIRVEPPDDAARADMITRWTSTARDGAAGGAAGCAVCIPIAHAVACTRGWSIASVHALCIRATALLMSRRNTTCDGGCQSVFEFT